MGDDGRVGEGGRGTLGDWLVHEQASKPHERLWYHLKISNIIIQHSHNWMGKYSQQISASRNLCMTASHYRRRGLKVLVPAAMATAVVFLGAFILRKGRNEGGKEECCSSLQSAARQSGRQGWWEMIQKVVTGDYSWPPIPSFLSLSKASSQFLAQCMLSSHAKIKYCLF